MPGASLTVPFFASRFAEQFVVIKVDIDTALLEKKIVSALATSPFASLVDEVYFENHFLFGGGHSPWGDPPWCENGKAAPSKAANIACWWGDRAKARAHGFYDTVDDALALMQSLRHAGVRSHFWV